MKLPYLPLLRNLFSTAIVEAVAKIENNQTTYPQFYCEKLGDFTASDGRKYVVEITVRPETD